MATNGVLKFQGTNKATFVGATSNVVIDTVKSSFGVGVDVYGPTSNLHVVGNAYVSTELTVGGTVTAAGFTGPLTGAVTGDGSGLTALNATNITTGTLDAARIPTLDQNTTGSAATLTTAQTIGGVSFDGSAAIVPTTFNGATFSGLVSTKTSREFEFTGSESAAYARHFWICSFKDAPGEHTNQLIKINYSATYKRTTGSHTRNSIASGTVTFSDLWKMSTDGNASDVQYYTLQDQKNELYYSQGRLPKWYYVRFNDIGYLVLSMSISDSNSADWYVKGNIDFLSRPGTESGENIWNGTIFRDSDTATTEGFTAISSLYPTSGTGEVGWDTSMASGSTAQTFLEATEGTIFKHGNVGIGTTAPSTKLHIGPSDSDHIYLASANNDYGWKIDTDDQGGGEVPFRLYRRVSGTDTLALSVANQNSRVNHTHSEKYNFHWNPSVWGYSTNINTTDTDLWSFTLNVPYDGWIFIKCNAHWARTSDGSAHVGGNASFYAWLSVGGRTADNSSNFDTHTGTSGSSYDKFHSYQAPDASGAGSWRDFNYSNFYKVSAGDNTISLIVNNYFGSSHYLNINGGAVSGFYMPRNYL